MKRVSEGYSCLNLSSGDQGHIRRDCPNPKRNQRQRDQEDEFVSLTNGEYRGGQCFSLSFKSRGLRGIMSLKFLVNFLWPFERSH